MDSVLQYIQQEQLAGKKLLAVLIDPDSCNLDQLHSIIDQAVHHQVDLFFIGGSLILEDQLNNTLQIIRQYTQIPLVLFPGSTLQISALADAILLPVLVSGRNAEFLIGQHIIAAPYIRSAGLEAISVGYMLVDGGKPTTASYMSASTPIPANKPSIAAVTAMASEMLGYKMVFLDAGSGATNPVNSSMIAAVRKQVACPIVVGGGIRTPEDAEAALTAGANIIVVGNAIEENPSFISELSEIIKRF